MQGVEILLKVMPRGTGVTKHSSDARCIDLTARNLEGCVSLWSMLRYNFGPFALPSEVVFLRVKLMEERSIGVVVSVETTGLLSF